MAQPDIPKAIVMNYRGQGLDFIRLKHEYKEMISLFQVYIIYLLFLFEFKPQLGLGHILLAYYLR